MPLKRRVMFLAAALVVAGCASEKEQAERAPESVAPAVTASATPTASTTASAAGTRTVRHEMGVTGGPAAPARVVVLDSPLLD